MNNSKKQIHIIEKNKKIVNAVLVTEMMACKGFRVFMKNLTELENSIRYQDILGIKDGALADQKGIALGIAQVKDYFQTMSKTAEQPRIDPETGIPEKLKKNN